MSAHERRTPPVLTAAIVAATVFAAWLRTHRLGDQLVQDDEWHAIHKLMTAGYGEIFHSFGRADHSIPLTLLYKALAESIGLDEIDMRALQVVCGTALVPIAATLAWHVTKRATTTVLFSLLLADAPLLVLYSRTARPYAITTLLVVVVSALLWRWRSTRLLGTGVAIAAVSGLAAWLHPVSSLYPAVGILFIAAEDLVRRPQDLRRTGATVVLGFASSLVILALLVAPLLSDVQSLIGKTGEDFADLYTFSRVLSLFAGGLPDALTVLVVGIAIFGALRIWSIDARLGLFLIVIATTPIALAVSSGAPWTHQGHTLARYVFPSQVIFLGWVAYGVGEAVGSRRVRAGAACAAAAVYVTLNPTIRQVTSLGPWYGHIYHQFDYVLAHNDAARQYAGFEAPDFYRVLAGMPPGSTTIIEAPFTFDAPANPMAFFALQHRQRALPGFIHDLCLDDGWYGEVPKDRRFRFRNFVFVDDPKAVRATGARYLIFYREQFHGVRPFPQANRCVSALTRLYGNPIEADARVVVYDLSRTAASERVVGDSEAPRETAGAGTK